LQYCRWAVAGLGLIETYFPKALAQYGDLGQVNWWDLLVDLVNLAEDAGWFEPEWEVLNQAWVEWLENSEDSGASLATFLRDIPFKLYGFNREPASIQIFNAEPGLFIEFFPPAELLYVLLDPAADVVSSGLLVAAELYDRWDDWDEASREMVWKPLHNIEVEPEAYPESARWLPALARWACSTTDNPILKRSFSLYYGDGGERFSWKTDVDKARLTWQEAKPVIKQFDRLLKWCRESATNLVSLADFLTDSSIVVKAYIQLQAVAQKEKQRLKELEKEDLLTESVGQPAGLPISASLLWLLIGRI
jgi:hypothetical protein